MLYKINTEKVDNFSNTETHVNVVAWNSETKQIERYPIVIYCDYACDAHFEIPEMLPMNHLIEAEVKLHLMHQFNAQVHVRMQEYEEIVSKLNNECKPQKIGQKVVVLSGKHKGMGGVIFFTCEDKFKRTYYNKMSFMADTILRLIRSSKAGFKNDLKDIIGIKCDGKATFVKTEVCQVVEGFERYAVPDSMIVESEVSSIKSNWDALTGRR